MCKTNDGDDNMYGLHTCNNVSEIESSFPESDNINSFYNSVDSGNSLLSAKHSWVVVYSYKMSDIDDGNINPLRLYEDVFPRILMRYDSNRYLQNVFFQQTEESKIKEVFNYKTGKVNDMDAFSSVNEQLKKIIQNRLKKGRCLEQQVVHLACFMTQTEKYRPVCKLSGGKKVLKEDFNGLEKHLKLRFNDSKIPSDVVFMMQIHSGFVVDAKKCAHSNLLIFDNKAFEIVNEGDRLEYFKHCKINVSKTILFDSNGPYTKGSAANQIRLCYNTFGKEGDSDSCDLGKECIVDDDKIEFNNGVKIFKTSDLNKMPKVIKTPYHLQNGPTCTFCTVGAARYYAGLINDGKKISDLENYNDTIDKIKELEQEFEKIGPIIDRKDKFIAFVNSQRMVDFNIIDYDDKKVSVDELEYDILINTPFQETVEQLKKIKKLKEETDKWIKEQSEPLEQQWKNLENNEEAQINSYLIHTIIPQPSPSPETKEQTNKITQQLDDGKSRQQDLHSGVGGGII